MGIGELLSRIVDDAKLAFDPRNMVAGAQYALDDPVGFGQDFFKGYAELIRHPIRNFSEHPLLSAMAVAPVVPPAVRLSKLMSDRSPDPMDLPGDGPFGPAQRGPFGPQEGPFRIGQNIFEEDGLPAGEFPPLTPNDRYGSDWALPRPDKPFQLPKGTFSIKGDGTMDIGYGLPNSRFEELLGSAKDRGTHQQWLYDFLEDFDSKDTDANYNTLEGISSWDESWPGGNSPQAKSMLDRIIADMRVEDMNGTYDNLDVWHTAAGRHEGRNLQPEDIPDNLFEDVFGETPAGMDDVIDPEVFNDRLNDNYLSEFTDPDPEVQLSLAETMVKSGIYDNDINFGVAGSDVPELIRTARGGTSPRGRFAPFEPEPRYRMFEEVSMLPGMGDNSMFANSERQHLLQILARLRAQRGF